MEVLYYFPLAQSHTVLFIHLNVFQKRKLLLCNIKPLPAATINETKFALKNVILKATLNLILLNYRRLISL
jgi:hypothetical protein